MEFLEEGRSRRERWVKHYASFHRILLVGEGDFSFALCLAHSFGSASNIVATSLDSYDVVIGKYKRGRSNLQQLHMFGATLVFGVDATKMKDHASDFANWRFDRIVYNFPHVGFYGKEDNPKLIRMHQELVDGFLNNAADMLQPHGEVHVSHKTTMPFRNWNIPELALRNSLNLLECVSFNIEDYPGYDNKRGAGARADDPFPLGECCTYKFVLDSVMNKTFHDMIQYNRARSDIIRFNISGVSMGEPGLAGCGGAMKDEDGNLVFVFSVPLGILEYEVAELCAFEIALDRLLRFRLSDKRLVIIRTKSHAVVSWLRNPKIRPTCLMKHFIEIDAMLELTSAVRIELIDREGNLDAESWAKKAILGRKSFEAGF